MPNFLDAPELLPLPSLRTYTSISVLLLSISLYYAFSVTSDLDWKTNSHYGFNENYDQHTPPDLQLLNATDQEYSQYASEYHLHNETFDWGDYFENILAHYDVSENFKELLQNPAVLRLFDVAFIMINEPLCVWTLINMSYCLLILVGKVIQKLIFGPLRASEQQLVRDKFWNFLIYKFIFVFSVINVQYMDELILWCGWFSILGFMLVLTYLCKERFNYLAFSPVVSKWAHARLMTLLIFIAISTIPLFVLGIIVGWSVNFSIGLFLISEALLLCLRTIYCIVLYGVHLVDLNRETAWENRATINYYIQLIFDLIILSIDLCHHLHMLFWSNIILSVSSLVIVIQLRSIYSEISQRFRKHRNYLQVLKLMQEQFSVATKEDIENNDDDCAICWESMSKARKLPCGHLFHTNCLRSWLEQDTSCPTCRSSLRPATNPIDGPQDGGGPGAGGHNHFFHFDGSRYARWLPTVSVEVRGPHNVDININASIGQGFIQRVMEQSPPQPQIDQRILEQMSANVHEWFPQIPIQVIQQDLRLTRSIEMTMENIIDGRIHEHQVNNDDWSSEDDSIEAHDEVENVFHSPPTNPISTVPTTTSAVSSSTSAPVASTFSSMLSSANIFQPSTSSTSFFSQQPSTSSTTRSTSSLPRMDEVQPQEQPATKPQEEPQPALPVITEEFAKNFHRLSPDERHSLFEIRKEQMYKKARDAFSRGQQLQQQQQQQQQRQQPSSEGGDETPPVSYIN